VILAKKPKAFDPRDEKEVNMFGKKRLNVNELNPTSKIVVYGILIVIAVLWTIPTLGLLVTSIRPPDDASATGWWTVFSGNFHFTLENYVAVLGNGSTVASNTASNTTLNQAIVNTIIMALPSTVIPIFLAAIAAYAFAWMSFPGRKILFMILVALLVVPLQMSLIPILRDYRGLGLNGTFLGVWLANTGFGLPLATYLLYNYIVTLPREVFESAVIDGASHPMIFSRLIIPLSLPAFASFAIFQFLWVWNGVLIPLIFLGDRPNVTVLPQRILQLLNNYGQNWTVLTAGAFVSMAIPLFVFIAFQRYFVRGMLAGSVKG
jgi:alpha-glucoside transport system permease protein